MKSAKRILALLLCAIFLLSLAACSLTKPSGSVTIQVLDEAGQPVSAVKVYTGNYPDGREPWPPPEAGTTDDAGKVEFSPVSYGAQPVCVYDALAEEYLYSGQIEVGRKDIQNGTVYTVTVSNTDANNS